jgi:hypothetical protein
MDDNIEKHVCIKFRIKLGKSAAETLEMLREAFEEHPFIWTAFFNGIQVSRPAVRC